MAPGFGTSSALFSTVTIAAANPIAAGPGNSSGTAAPAKGVGEPQKLTNAAVSSPDLSFRARWQLLVPADSTQSSRQSEGIVPSGTRGNSGQSSFAPTAEILMPPKTSSAPPAPQAESAPRAEPKLTHILAPSQQLPAAQVAVSGPKTAGSDSASPSRLSAARKPLHSSATVSGPVSALVLADPGVATQILLAPVPAPVLPGLVARPRSAQGAAPGKGYEPPPIEVHLPNAGPGTRLAHPLAQSRVESTPPSSVPVPSVPGKSGRAADAEPCPAASAPITPLGHASTEETQQVGPRRIPPPASSLAQGAASPHGANPQSAPPALHRAESVASEDQPPPDSTHPYSGPSAVTSAEHPTGDSNLRPLAAQAPVPQHAESATASVILGAATPLNDANPTDSANPERSANISARDTIAALDAAPLPPTATWVHADAAHAEAGYLDSSLGWVSVHADTAGSVLHASIVPSSPEAAQVLGSHLAGLNTYLADRHVTAAQLTVAAPQSGQSFAAQSGFDGSGRQQGQQPGQEGQPTAATQFQPNSLRAADVASASFGTPVETYAVPWGFGSHISVIA